MTDRSHFHFDRGAAYVFFQYDVGLAIDLERCRSRIAGAALAIRPRGAPEWFDFDPRPLLVSRDAPPVAVGGAATDPGVWSVIYDFGAISVSYRVPLAGDLASLVEASARLADDAVLRAESRREVERILAAIHPAVDGSRMTDVVEDYVVFQITLAPGSPSLAEVLSLSAQDLARVLRQERGPLSAQEVSTATAGLVSYGPDDAALIDWQAALLIGADLADARAVLELASIQLLELRALDLALDRALARSYERLTAGRRWWPGAGLSADERTVALFQVEQAVLFERVTNALKLFGDQYLATVYAVAAGRFRLGDWTAAVGRKLETLDGIYQKLTDRAAARRMEALEWIIILLIAFEIVLSLA